MGRPVRGYEKERCIVSEPLALALAAAQKDAKKAGLGLKVYDGYRPLRAVNDFMLWCTDSADDALRAEFHPDLDKSAILRDGYLSPESTHCCGSAVDLTLVSLAHSNQLYYRQSTPLVRGDAALRDRSFDSGLDMGTVFDFFGPASHTMCPNIDATAKENRALLKSLLESHGLVNYDKEWWHYALPNPPTRERFDVVVG